MSFQDKIRQIIAALDDVAELSKKEAVASIFGEAEGRIFNSGLDKNDNSIGSYSKSYSETRKDRGLQTGFVDLTFSGSLKQSIALNDKQIYFKNEYGQRVSGYNETHFNKRIFAPSQKEKKIFFDILNENLKKLWKSTSS